MDLSNLRACAIIVVVFVGLIFVLDMISLAWAMIAGKKWKSIFQGFYEHCLEYRTMFWFPLVIAALFVYGLFFCTFINI